MNIRSFLKLVEIQTKVASVIPFLLGTIYAVYRFKGFNLENFIFMFISLLAFDMATTAINNYMDYKKAQKKHGYGYETHNAIVSHNLKEWTVVAVIITLIVTALVFGFLLFLNTNIVILLLGTLSFIVGVLYSFGPVPISRMPLGELFSGLFMGFVIVFISTYIHVYDNGILNIAYTQGILTIDMKLIEIIYIFLVSMPAVSGIANIMLANNICDMEDDLENRRYTLPIYIGKERALKLFKMLYYIAFSIVVLLLLLRIEPLVSSIMLLTIIPVSKNIKGFYKVQTKKDTFIFAVKNFVLMNIVLVLTIALGAI